MIAQIYARNDGTIAHVADDSLPLTPDMSVTLIIQFDATIYSTEYQHIADKSKGALWDGANLLIDGAVYLDALWIATRQAELTQAETIETEDTTERSTLLSQYNAAVTQIGNDLADVVAGQTAMQTQPNSVTKSVILGVLTILQHQLNREERELKALRAILRSGLDNS